MRKIYVDSIEVTELINSKTNYTWLKCKDNKTRKVKTPEYDNCNNNTHTFSAQSTKKGITQWKTQKMNANPTSMQLSLDYYHSSQTTSKNTPA